MEDLKEDDTKANESVHLILLHYSFILFIKLLNIPDQHKMGLFQRRKYVREVGDRGQNK